MNILFLDLSEEDTGGGLGHRGADYLRERAHHNVKFVSLQKLLAYEVDPKSEASAEELAAVRREIESFNRFDEIYLSAHGHCGDIENFYIDIFGSTEELKCGVQDLSKIMNVLFSFFPDGGLLKIQFVVCYGARTAENIDHITEQNPEKFKETLAGNFIHHFCKDTRSRFSIQLSAYTGRIRFNESTRANDGRATST